MLDVAAKSRLGEFALDVRFSAEGGGITALFGRSGAGKTSTVNLIAGLRRPESGRITLNGEALFDSEQGIDVAPERRRIGYVFQEGRLFPHLSVAGNLKYGMKRIPAHERAVSFDHVVALLDLGDFLHRNPADLSGGEKQRVAVGRALLASPKLLLMDEPLASLDAARKAEIMPFIEGLRDELRIPVIYVSHVIEEIVRLADRVVLISDGRVAAQGPVDNVMSRIDLQPLTGRHEAGAVVTATVSRYDADYDLTDLGFAGGILQIPGIKVPPGAELRVRIRARDVALSIEEPRGLSIRNVFRGTVTDISAGGAFADVVVDVGAPIWARITTRSLHDLNIAPGSKVFVLVKSVAIDGRSLGRRGRPIERDI